MSTPLPSGRWVEIVATVQSNLLIGASLLALFELGRSKRSVYQCRLRHCPGRAIPVARTPLGWARDVSRVDWDELRDKVGLDAFYALRFLRVCRNLFGAAAAAAAVTVGPAFASCSGGAAGFYRWTLGNCDGDADRARLWAAVAFAYAFSALALGLVEVESRRYLRDRLGWLRRGDGSDSPQARCSVLVERVPPRLRSDAALRRYFEALFGDRAVHSAVSFVDTADVAAALDARDRALDAYEWEVLGSTGADYASLEGSVARGRAATLRRRLADADAAVVEAQRTIAAARRRRELRSAGGDDDDDGASALHVITAELEGAAAFLGAVAGVNDAVKKHLGDGASSTGVVTFFSPALAAEAAQLVLTSRPGDVCATLAPPRSDLVWRNVSAPARDVAERLRAADAGLVLLAAVYAPLVASVQALCNLDVLAKYVPFIAPLASDPRYERSRALVSGLLPVYALLALLGVLPLILEALAVGYAGAKTRSEAHGWVAARYASFQLLQIFVTVASGSLLSVFERFLDHPKSLLDLLGRALPGMGAYFLQLVVAKVCFALAFELARPVALVSVVARQGYTRRATVPARVRRRLRAPSDFDYGSYLPDFFMVVVVGAIYAPIAPPVVAAVALYFAGAELVYAHQFLCVYVARYETGGAQTWPHLSACFFLALAVGQATLAGQLLILEAPEAAAALAPLLVLTLKARSDVRANYEEPARFLDRESSVRFGLYSRRAAHHAALAARSLSLSFSCDLDGDDDSAVAGGGAATGAKLAADYYLQPALAAPPVVLDGDAGT